MIPIFKDIFVQKNYLGKALISSVPEQREGTEVVEIAVQDVCLLDFKLRRLMMTSLSKSPPFLSFKAFGRYRSIQLILGGIR